MPKFSTESKYLKYTDLPDDQDSIVTIMAAIIGGILWLAFVANSMTFRLLISSRMFSSVFLSINIFPPTNPCSPLVSPTAPGNSRNATAPCACPRL